VLAGEGTSLSLDGKGGYVEIPRGRSLALGEEMTIEVEFLYQPAGGSLPLLSNVDKGRSSRGNYCLRILRRGARINVEFGFEPTSVTDHVYRTKPAEARLGFNHVAVAFRYGDGRSIRMYLNARPVGGSWVQGNGNAKPRPNKWPLLVGASEMGLRGFWRGNIRRLAIWNVLRSQAEVQSDMRALSGKEKGLVGYWMLETDAKDATMNKNHGKRHGGAQFGPPQTPAQPPPLRPMLQGNLRLNLRTRVQPFKGSDTWHQAIVRKEFPVAETAILLCDVWDRHWCKSATRRLNAMIPRMNRVVRFARKRGVQIIHAPSDTMGFYANTPHRLRAMAAPHAKPPKPRSIPSPRLPIDASDGGCDDQPKCRSGRAWKRQHPGIEIAGHDAISDNGREVYNLLRQLGIRNLILMGVHTNMCVLGRSFAIKQMTRWGIRCVLVRDLTDTMYNPRRPPHVSHDRGTELVIEYIEKYWCPSIRSDDLLKVYPPKETAPKPD